VFVHIPVDLQNTVTILYKERGTALARYIENGNAKIAPCTCSTGAIFEKGCDRQLKAIWCCRNCGETMPRRVSRRIASGIRINLDGDLETRGVDGVWRTTAAELAAELAS